MIDRNEIVISTNEAATLSAMFGNTVNAGARVPVALPDGAIDELHIVAVRSLRRRS